MNIYLRCQFINLFFLELYNLNFIVFIALVIVDIL